MGNSGFQSLKNEATLKTNSLKKKKGRKLGKSSQTMLRVQDILEDRQMKAI